MTYLVIYQYDTYSLKQIFIIHFYWIIKLQKIYYDIRLKNWRVECFGTLQERVLSHRWIVIKYAQKTTKSCYTPLAFITQVQDIKKQAQTWLQTLIEIFKSDIEMGYGNDIPHLKKHHNKDKNSKATSTNLKEMLFEVIAAHITQNAALSPIPYYVLTFIESLSLMWFLIHPALNLFSSSGYFITQINMVLKAINFYEYMGDQANQYPVIVIAAFSFLIVQCILAVVSGLAVIKKTESQAAKYLKKIVNILFLITVKVLSGPLMGLCINVIYCDNVGPYHKGQICYTPSHIFYCGLVGFIFVIVLGHIILFATLYSIRNPFSGSFLAEPSRFYMYSKSIIKFIGPLYFALKSNLGLQQVYQILAPLLWGGYIFFHRLFSIHSYKQSHFYLQYMMQGVLFWVAINGALIYQFQVIPMLEELCFVYVLLTALMVGYMVVNIEKWHHNKFMEECLQGEIKKQNMDKFMLSLVDCFLYRNNEQGKITFKVYSRIIWHKNQANHKDKLINEQHVQDEGNWSRQVHRFLLQQLELYLKQSKSVILKTMRCYLLSFLGLKNSCFHQSLELQQQRLSLIDQFAVFYFRKSTKCSYELPYRDSAEYVKFFMYQQEVNVMQQLMEECALNNIEYWQELCESDPSLPKLRNLATLYIDYSSKIAEQYAKVSSIMPNCLAPTTHYMHFLVNIGVDVRDTMKVRQTLKSRLQNKQGLNIVLGGRLREEDLHMITIDTVGNNLGIIKNCSTQLKDLLGYDKKSIVGKQVTKIMPKIYTQLHNTFILDYIHHKSKQSTSLKDIDSTKDSSDHPEKIVTPINADHLLIEVGLSLQMYTAYDSSLVMGGVIRKRVPGQEGVIMVEGHTGEILGVDKNFVKLMREKITGKQIVQQEIRLSAYLPEVNIEEIESQGFQNTLLQIGHLLQQENMRNLKLNVRVQLRQVKHYNDHKIVFLSIIESVNAQDASSMKEYSSKRCSLTAELEIMELIAKKQNFKQTTKNFKGSDVSISFSDRQLQTRDYDNLTDEMPLARKLDDYIQMKQDSKMEIINNICYIVVTLLLSLFLVITFIVHNDYLNQITNLYREMELISDIPYQLATINLNINQIWSIPDRNYSAGNLTTYANNIKSSVYSLSNSLTQVIQATQNYNYPLQYNEQNTYNFRLSIAINGSFTTYNTSLSLIDGLLNYVATARLYMDTNRRFADSPITQLLRTQQIQYISINGDEILPAISENVINKFGSYFRVISEDEVKVILFSKGGLMAFSIVCLIGGLVFGKYLNKTNQEVLDFYHLIRLWDVCQMAYKCDQYLKLRFKTIRKQRTSSLLKIFPLKTFVDIIQNNNTKDNININNTLTVTPASQLLQRYNNLESLQAEDKPNLPQKEQDSLLKKDNMVTLQWQQNHQKAILAVSIVLLTIITIIGISMFLFYTDMKNIQSSFELLQNIGLVRKNLVFLSVYAFKISKGLTQNDYYKLIANEVRSFYRYSDLTYAQLGDAVFKKVYAETEIIQKYFTTANTINQSSLSTMYSTSINSTLANATNSILNLDSTVFKPSFRSLISSNQQNELIMKIAYGVLGVLALLLMHFCYIKPIKAHRRYTINMLRMLPSWLLQRAPEAVASINK